MIDVFNREGPAIFPRQSAPFAVLAITLTVMCTLACLALGGLLLAERATAAWTQGLTQQATIILQSEANGEAEKVMALLKDRQGILSAQAYPVDETRKLLRPWLGQDLPDDLALPRLIGLVIDTRHPPDFAALEKDLASIKGASLDTHQRWQQEFARLGRNLAALALFILALITVASIALVAYAARAVMEANRNVVDVLELAGAGPRYISRANDGQFLLAGLAAGFAGLALALVVVAAVSRTLPAISNLLFGADLRLATLATLSLVPLAATLIAVWTARFTLLRLLERNP